MEVDDARQRCHGAVRRLAAAVGEAVRGTRLVRGRARGRVRGRGRVSA